MGVTKGKKMGHETEKGRVIETTERQSKIKTVRRTARQTERSERWTQRRQTGGR